MMDYVIIMPAYNEAENIEATLRSIAGQSLLPKRLIVVNDGSSDNTAGVVTTLIEDYPWISLVNNFVKPKHAPGGKVVRAFYKGYAAIDRPYDVVVKLDADLILPPDYFESIAAMFEEDPELGIAGGINLVERGGAWVYENFADRDHVRGAYKAYRQVCFEDIGGLRESVGWDTVDELLAIYHGWKVATNPSLVIKHVRARGTSTGFVRVMAKVGRAMYRMRYGLLITLISAGKAGLVNRPYFLTGLAVIRGWLQAWWKNDPFIVSREEGQFIRSYRWRRMVGKFSVNY